MFPVKDAAFVHRFARSVQMNRWLRRAVVAEGRNIQFRSSADAKRENPAKAWFHGAPSWKIPEAGTSSPSSHQRDVLHSIDNIGYRRRQDARSSVVLPQFLSVSGAIGQENSVGAALKDEIPRRSEHSSRLHAWMDHVPCLSLFYRIPRDQLADWCRSCQLFGKKRAFIASVLASVPIRRVGLPTPLGSMHRRCSF